MELLPHATERILNASPALAYRLQSAANLANHRGVGSPIFLYHFPGVNMDCKSVVVTFRVNENQAALLGQIAQMAGRDRSAVVRGLLDYSQQRLPKLPADIAAAIYGEVGE